MFFYPGVLDPNHLPPDCLADPTNQVYAPATESNMSVSPNNPIVLNQGEKSAVDVRTNSITGMTGEWFYACSLSSNRKNNSSVLMKFDLI